MLKNFKLFHSVEQLKWFLVSPAEESIGMKHAWTWFNHCILFSHILYILMEFLLLLVTYVPKLLA